MSLEQRLRRLATLRDLLVLGLLAGCGAVAAAATVGDPEDTAVVAAAVIVSGGLAWVATTRRAHRCLDQLLRRYRVAVREQDQREEAESEEYAGHRRRIQQVLNVGDSLRIEYQPIVDLTTSRVVGYEALSRFASDGSPDAWFAEAHAVDLGTELEMLAVSRAIDDPPAEGYLSVNVSPTTFASAAFRDFLDERMMSRLVVELTEHVSVDDYGDLEEAVTLLRDLGGRLAVDDAGSGYASMRHVVSLAPDIIKLDRSLVSCIDTDSGRREMARSLSRFARRTGASLVAEGIERPEELAACREVGVDCGQGYLLGRPAPAGRVRRNDRISLGPTS